LFTISGLNSTIRDIRVKLVLAGVLALLPSGAMAQYQHTWSPIPHGLVAVIPNDPTTPLDPIPFCNPYISGIALQIHWQDIEPVQGQPDWTRLDQLFWAAQFSHKWVQLLMFPGFWSPAWALKGAQTGMFTVQYGPGNGDYLPLPMPWDPVYLANWSDFVKRVADRYGNCPAFRVVAVAGPTSVSDEFTLPEAPDEVKEWLADGYTNAKYIEAWRQMSEVYVEDFPNQYVSISLGQGLPVNDQGQIDNNQPLVTRSLVVDAVSGVLGSQFTLQESNLDGNASTTTDAETEFVLNYNGRAVTGYQLRTNCLNNPVNMSGQTDPAIALQLSIENGMQLNDIGKHADYIETYNPDVDAAIMQPVLQWGASLFWHYRW